MQESGARRHLPARQLVDNIGPALLRLIQEGTGCDGPLTEIAIYAPGAPTQLGPGCVVLGVGVTTEAELRELTAAMERGAARVVAVKAPVPPSADEELTIIEVNQNASWMHVATTVREQLLEYARMRVRSVSSGSELFSLANAIYEALGAPVTIEDRFSALVAWSEGQDKTDAERIETILGRAVQPRTLAEQRERHEFERLHASSEPVYMEATEPDQLPRVAIVVRAARMSSATSGPRLPGRSTRRAPLGCANSRRWSRCRWSACEPRPAMPVSSAASWLPQYSEGRPIEWRRAGCNWALDRSVYWLRPPG